MADMANVTFNELLGADFSEKDYAVSSNWRIDFATCKKFVELLGGDVGIAQHLSYACTTDYTFNSETTYAQQNIKGISISQAAWQTRVIDNLQITVLEPMDRSVENALIKAQNKGAGYFGSRDIAAKNVYTFSGITLIELGNDGKANPDNIIILDGAQIKGVQPGTFTSGNNAEIVGTQFTLFCHGWHKPFEA
jgi:hypothetical protein